MIRHYDLTENGVYRGVIYKRTLKLDGRVYVGETANEKIRIQKWNTKSNRRYGGALIDKARQELGIGSDVWDYEVLEEIFKPVSDELENALLERQTYWINKYDSCNPEKGFNKSMGNGMQGLTHSAESRAKISKNHRKNQTEETKKKISASNKGRKQTQEAKDKISASNKGKRRTPEQRAAQSERMKGKIPMAAKLGADKWREENGGSYWKGKKMSDEAKANMKQAQQKKGKSCVAIFPDGHEEIFNTYLDAAKATGHNVGSVASCIKTNGTTKKGFRFKKI